MLGVGKGTRQIRMQSILLELTVCRLQGHTIQTLQSLVDWFADSNAYALSLSRSWTNQNFITAANRNDVNCVKVFWFEAYGHRSAVVYITE